MIALVLLVLAPSSTTFAHRFDALLALDANASAAPTVDAPPIELVETAPIETTLDHADIPNAADVWLEMIGGAKRSIDLAEFYVSDQAPSKFTPIVEAATTFSAPPIVNGPTPVSVPPFSAVAARCSVAATLR